jgi:muramoyltetrapeptide carboxypeptidase
MSQSHPPIRVAVIAASSAVPQVELAMGVEHLRSAGIEVELAENCAAQHFVFAGTDRERADALYAAACSDRYDALWCACGGYGATRLLPILQNLTDEKGIPPFKRLIGFSDSTAIMSFARTRWNWKTIHAPMLVSTSLHVLDEESLRAIATGITLPEPWGTWQLKWIAAPPAQPIEAELIGGNLAVWTAMTGTPFSESARGKFLLLEDIEEIPYRIDRLTTQLRCSGRLEGVAAIVLGTFTNCDDRVSMVMRSAESSERVPLRKSYAIDEALAIIFGDLGMPVVSGLPVGHGFNSTAVPLGARYRLDAGGTLRYVAG